MKTVHELRAELARDDMEYSEYMAALRDNLPVSDYMLHGRTAVYAILMFVSLGVVFYFLLPAVMFGSFTVVAWLVLVAAFVGMAWAYYEYVYYPNEMADFEEADLAQPEEVGPDLDGGEGP